METVHSRKGNQPPQQYGNVCSYIDEGFFCGKVTGDLHIPLLDHKQLFQNRDQIAGSGPCSAVIYRKIAGILPASTIFTSK